MTIDRYDTVTRAINQPMYASPSGDWVKFSDVERLLTAHHEALDTLRHQLEAAQLQAIESDRGACLSILEAGEARREADTLRQERDKLAGDLLEEESQHHWTRDYLKAAEAECGTIRAQRARLVQVCQMALSDRMYTDWPKIADALMDAIEAAGGTLEAGRSVVSSEPQTP